MTRNRTARRSTGLRLAAVIAALMLAGLVGSAWIGRSRPRVVLEVPGSQPAFASGHRVRVNLTPQPARSVTIDVGGAFEVRPVGSDRVLLRSTGTQPISVRATPGGLKVGTQDISVARIVIHPARSPAIWVNDHLYRGDLAVYRRSGGRVMAVNVVDLEQYIASVVDSEMPAKFPPAARRAQAIVARTYVLYQQQLAGAAREFDVYATTRSQKYLGYQYRDGRGRKLAGESQSSRAVARDTAGMVALYRGELFAAYYSAVCGGRTANGPSVFADAVDALVGVPCQWCRAAERYRWNRSVEREQAGRLLSEHFRRQGQPFQRLKTCKVIAADAAHSGSRFEVGDGTQRYQIDGTALRRLFSGSLLPSPFFSARLDGDRLVFSGRGHGHGVGLCQWGARGQALAGRSAARIVATYYPGVQLVTLDLKR